MNKLSGASYSAIRDAIYNQLDYLGGGEQYDLLLRALNELHAIYYGEAENNKETYCGAANCDGCDGTGCRPC